MRGYTKIALKCFLLQDFRIVEKTFTYVSKKGGRIVCNFETKKHWNLSSKVEVDVQSSTAKNTIVCMEYDKCWNTGNYFNMQSSFHSKLLTPFKRNYKFLFHHQILLLIYIFSTCFIYIRESIAKRWSLQQWWITD